MLKQVSKRVAFKKTNAQTLWKSKQKTEIDMNKADQMLGYIKTVYPATAISPDLSQLTITKEQNS